ncbi:phosphopantothenate--cysteine ligase [Streptococcus saliviloxodontae]|uniref:Phosphopantothenate-cysteine ligase n=1 Tax=Streptococcus saliviloxodontae TaxID=1349416 RepID=A0ABS2PL29_9STRE|nr:phosphopantothenate--cysteine ligase [Streptococcus saliviloxodontae]MBM7636138.1 phosphopantothenate-cysteine ligase [Streptococcus saliviloxodontae]
MKVLITSGGTTEKIDSVRGITNHSTGNLGKLIAERFLAQGHEVSLVTTKQAVKPEASSLLHTYIVSTVDSLLTTMEPLVKSHDLVIHSMAVSDYTPVYMTDLDDVLSSEDLTKLLTKSNQESKISSQADYQVLFLKKTPKVISLIKQWNPDICLIGFKLLVNVSRDELFSVARASLQKNQADYILANDLNEITSKQHHAYLLSDNQISEAFTKQEIADVIYEQVTHND